MVEDDAGVEEENIASLIEADGGARVEVGLDVHVRTLGCAEVADQWIRVELGPRELSGH